MPRINNREKIVSSVSWHWENWTSLCKRMKLNPCLTSHTQTNSKMNRKLNLKNKTGNNKTPRRKHRGKAPWQSVMINWTPKAQATKAVINKSTLNCKASAQQKKPSTKWKSNLQNGRKYVQTLSDKKLLSKIYKELIIQ